MHPRLLAVCSLVATMVLGCGAPAPPFAETVVPIEIVGTSPIIEIKVNGKSVPVHFDLGNSDSVSLFLPS